jgi:hypothetical protein
MMKERCGTRLVFTRASLLHAEDASVHSCAFRPRVNRIYKFKRQILFIMRQIMSIQCYWSTRAEVRSVLKYVPF